MSTTTNELTQIPKKALPMLGLETSLTEHYVSVCTKWPGAGTSVWQHTVGGLNRYSLAVTEADALLRTALTTSTLGMWQPTKSACSPSQKEHYEHLMQGNLFDCYKCLLRKKCLWPKITHTKSEKLSELRLPFTNRLLDWRRAFHRKYPLWYCQSEGTHLPSCQTDLIHLFPAFPSC